MAASNGDAERMGVEALAQALGRAAVGERAAYDDVFAATYAELKQLARGARRALRGGTLNTTGIVHECYLRLMKSPLDVLLVDEHPEGRRSLPPRTIASGSAAECYRGNFLLLPPRCMVGSTRHFSATRRAIGISSASAP
jgi:hypothetical protein